MRPERMGIASGRVGRRAGVAFLLLGFLLLPLRVLALEPLKPWMLADWQNPTPHLADTGLKPGELASAIGRRLVILPHPERDIVIPSAGGPRSLAHARFVSAVAVVDLPAATARRRMQEFGGYKHLFPLLPESEIVTLDGHNLVARYRLEIPLPAMADFTVDFRVKHTLEQDGSISALLIDGKAESLVAMLGGMTDNLADQPVVARWEFLPLNDRQSLLVFTYWDRLELKSFFARKFMEAYPELKVAGPYVVAMMAAEAIHRNFLRTVPVLRDCQPQGLQQFEKMRALLERFSAYGHVAVLEPDFVPAPGQAVPPLRFVSLATRIAAAPAATRSLATRYERLPEAMKEIRSVGVHDRGQQVDLNLDLHFAVLIIRFSLGLDLLNTWSTPQRLEFTRVAGQLAQLRGASEWHPLPGSDDTLMLISAAHEVGEEAPLLLRLAHKLADRGVPYVDQLGSLAVQLVAMERLKPWVERNAAAGRMNREQTGPADRAEKKEVVNE